MELYVIIDDLACAVGRAVVRQLDGHPAVSGLAFLPGRCHPLPAPFVVLEEFLVRQELVALLDFTLSHERAFVETQVMQAGYQTGSINDDERRSRVVYTFEPCQAILVDRVLAVLPRVLDMLGRSPFHVTHVEAQLTASNDGEFFRPHNDNAHEALERREMTFVYYFNCEPKGFSGGELRIYDSPLPPVPGIDVPHTAIPPQQNQIVFFPSHLMHEVRPTHVPSRAFADSRFTVNGWLHR